MKSILCVVSVVISIILMYAIYKKYKRHQQKQKFFHEHPNNAYIDARYASNSTKLGRKEMHSEFYALIDAFEKWLHRFEGVDFWLDYGTALGCYRHKGIIPWDNDIDIGMTENDIKKLPSRWENDSYLWERNPIASLDIFDKHNCVSGRFISKQYGYFIDVFAYRVTNSNLMYNAESMNDKSKWVNIEFVFPLRRAKFGNGEYSVPNQLENYLLTYYNNDLSIPEKYKDFS
jgi:phosphorylcholine metabolism protein LicD